MSHVPGRALLALSLLVAPAYPTRAQAPSCDDASVGTVACFASKLCACTFTRGGGMAGIVAGYRWDCGVLRPGCGAGTALPATIDPYLGPLPSALSLDRTQTIVNTQTGAGSSNQTVTGDRATGGLISQPTVPGKQ
jgi:hypothetical protein